MNQSDILYSLYNIANHQLKTAETLSGFYANKQPAISFTSLGHDVQDLRLDAFIRADSAFSVVL